MEDFDDDFGELYADVELQASSAINGVPPDITKLCINVGNESGLGGDERREKDSGGENEMEVECGSGSGSDSDADFDVVVNDDDFRAKNGRENRNAGEDEEHVFVPMSREGNLNLKNRDGVDGGGMEQSGSGYGGERGHVGKNGCHSQYKFVRQHESVSTGNQRVISSSRGEREDVGYIQNRRTSLGRVGPSYAGTFPGLSEHGSGFWLPWNRTILDVEIGIFEQKPWTLPEADITDYFNFGFDEESWKSYCQSLDQLRRQGFSQSQNKANRLRSKLDNDATATEEAVNEKSIHNEDIIRMQIGQAIHVEDSYIERQPSMDAKHPRTRDSDVVIEITMQDPEDSSSGKAESDKIQKTRHAILEDGCGIDNVKPQTERSTSYKSHDMAKDSVEENIHSPSASSELKRSYESGAGSSVMLQDPTSQGKGCMPKSDAFHPGKIDAFSRGCSRAVEKLNTSTEDATTNSADSNPCVAGIDVLFDDQIQSSPTSSDSVTWSKAPEDSDHCDLKRIKHYQRSSADSVLEGPVAEYDHLVSRENGRVDIKVRGSAVQRRSRARSPTKEDRKHHYQRGRKHSVVSNHNDEDDRYNIGIRRDIYDRSPLNAHCHRSKAKPHVSTFHEDRPRYREKESFLGCYDERIVERNTSCMREDYHRDHWGSRDEIGLRSPRGWDEDTFFSETRVKQTKGEIDEREWHHHEREGIIWDREQLFRNQPHYTSRYSVDDIKRRHLRKDFDDIHSNMRSRHELSLAYGYSDDPALERYARPYSLNCREAEHLDLDIERERCLQRIGREVGTSGRGDQYVETPPLDLHYPWYIRDKDEDWNWQASRSTRDYLDRHHAYIERRHGSTICGDDVDDPRLFEKHRRHDRFISHRSALDDRRLYYGIDDTHDRPYTFRSLDVNDCVVREQNDFQSKGMSWTDDKRSKMHFHNDLYDEEELDSFEGVSRHKWHETRSEFPGGMSLNTQIMKHKQRIVRGDLCDTRSKMPTEGQHQKIGIWCKRAGESRHVVRERKTVQPSGKCSKSRRDPDKELHESGTNNTKKIRAVNIEAMNHEKLHAKNHNYASDDIEEGQILPTEEPRKVIPKENRGGLKKMSHNQKVTNQNDLNVYDENRILETMAKMEKRRERFKEPILPKKETDSDPKPQVDPVLQTADGSKQQRPLRKRRWGGS